jgi:hypothetical protein
MTKARDLANIISGGFDATDIPNLDTAKITSGTFADARLPNLDTAKITSGTFADARMPSTVLNSNVSVQNQSAFKNIIINGSMDIAQRGTSKANIGFEYGTVDRFQTVQGSLGAFTQSQSTDVPTGQGFAKSLKMDCTTADASPSSGDELYIRQQIEGQNLQYLSKGTSSAKSLTVSFWVKSNKTGTYIVELFDHDNSRHINKSYTISSASTWEKKTITYDGDTTGAFNNDNGSSLSLSFMLGAGSNFTSGTLQTSWGTSTSANRQVGQVNLADSTSNEWYVTGVQLEAGTTASDFEFLPFDVSLRRCQRYFQKSYNYGTAVGNSGSDGRFYFALGFDTGTRNKGGGVILQTPMRASPTLTFYNDSGTSGQIQVPSGSPSTITNSNNHFNIYINTNLSEVYGQYTASSEL